MLDTTWCDVLWIEKTLTETLLTSYFERAIGNIFDIQTITFNIIAAVALPDR